MIYIKKLPEPEEIIDKYPLASDLKLRRDTVVNDLKNILAGIDNRKVLYIGPCSADREDSVIEYVKRLAVIQNQISKDYLIIPRVYTSKPRTNGIGYKGLLHRPNSSLQEDDLLAGVIATRKMHLHVIEESGLFCCDEMLYPETISYTIDLLAYVAIGARSVENQMHRLTGSGLSIPVGMKNPMSGDLNVMLNSIQATQYPQSLIYRGWAVKTEGNRYSHAILRGYLDSKNQHHPNYHYEDICNLYDMYTKANLNNMSVIIDCNHSNSGKNADEQIRIIKEVSRNCDDYGFIDTFVKGYMIESYLEDGCQLVGGNVFGKSITDPCLGWDKTEKLIDFLVNK